MMKSGVYAIRNKITNMVYVGCSRKIETRWEQHKLQLRAGAHLYKGFQRDWDKYGLESFEFFVIEETSGNNLRDVEKKWISHYGTLCYKREEIGEITASIVATTLRELEIEIRSHPPIKRVASRLNCTDATALKYLRLALSQNLIAQRGEMYMSLSIARAYDAQKD